MTVCDFCEREAKGEIIYDDGEVVIGCPDCILEIVADPHKPVHEIYEYTAEDMEG